MTVKLPLALKLGVNPVIAAAVPACENTSPVPVVVGGFETRFRSQTAHQMSAVLVFRDANNSVLC